MSTGSIHGGGASIIASLVCSSRQECVVQIETAVFNIGVCLRSMRLGSQIVLSKDINNMLISLGATLPFHTL